jgi:hypothetical protein
MITEIKIDDAIETSIAHKINQNAIEFSKRMIIEGIENDNISQVQFYTEMWCRYTDRGLRLKYPI